jgi:O-antigen/teichoic acid export membrane protein
MKNKKDSRIEKVRLNSTVAFISQVLQILLGFFIRKIFIYSLGVAYLGYNSVFTNILQMLSLADFGVEIAITGFLYKPLAENDMERVSALMFLFKKLYHIIGILVLLLGLVISIFLKVLIPDAACDIWYLRILFYLNLVGVVSTYFLAYKRTLLIADQKAYLTKLVDTIIFFTISVAQVVVLLVTSNYIIYLILNVLKNVISNIILLLKANRLYGKITKNIDQGLLQTYKIQLPQYIKDVFISRIGATIYYGTDNIILSVLQGSLLTGYLSNYTMITTQLSTVVNQVLSSLQASFGNYINSGKTLEEQKKMSDNYFCANFCIGSFCMVCFALLAQPFISLFFGRSLLLNFSTVLWLSINLMLTIMIQLPGQIFSIYKLFRYDRPIIIFSATSNIILSASLVKILGINGVLIGTFFTSLIYLFSRFYIISKHVYLMSYWKYVAKIFFYFGISTITLGITWFMVRKVPGNTIPSFVRRCITVSFLSILIPASCLAFSKEFQFLLDRLVPKKVRMFCNKTTLCILYIIVILITFL